MTTVKFFVKLAVAYKDLTAQTKGTQPKFKSVYLILSIILAAKLRGQLEVLHSKLYELAFRKSQIINCKLIDILLKLLREFTIFCMVLILVLSVK